MGRDKGVLLNKRYNEGAKWLISELVKIRNTCDEKKFSKREREREVEPKKIK